MAGGGVRRVPPGGAGAIGGQQREEWGDLSSHDYGGTMFAAQRPPTEQEITAITVCVIYVIHCTKLV